MTSAHRLFVAVVLPPDVEAHLGERIDPLRDAVPQLRWVPSSRWHLTCEFLGECGPYEVERQRVRWADRATRVAPFHVAVSGAGAFPAAIRARVLWAGVSVEPASWRRVAALDQQPHLTVARTKPARDLTGVVESLGSYTGPSWLVEQVALVESFIRSPGERGPRYEAQETFDLTGIPAAPAV